MGRVKGQANCPPQQCPPRQLAHYVEAYRNAPFVSDELQPLGNAAFVRTSSFRLHSIITQTFRLRKYNHIATFADFTAFPELTPDLVKAFIDSQLQRLRGLGYEVDSCLVDLGDTAEAVVAQHLNSRKYDCVMIGAGLRAPPQLLLFEWDQAPRQGRLAFVTSSTARRYHSPD